MYSYPKQIQIGGHTYTVELKDAATVDDAGQNCGDSCKGNLEFRVATKLVDGISRATSAIEQTLWHEILHQIDRVYASENQLDEGDMERLTQGLFQVFEQLDWHIIKEE